jgi:hypothetical protein
MFFSLFPFFERAQFRLLEGFFKAQAAARALRECFRSRG